MGFSQFPLGNMISQSASNDGSRAVPIISSAAEDAIGRRFHIRARKRVLARKMTFGVCAVIVLSAAMVSGAASQQKSLKDQLIGTWTLASWEQTYPDGRKDQAFSSTPKGIHTFSPDGRFAVVFLRPDLPKLASSDRVKPTPEEAMAVAKGAIAYYGTYTVDEADKIHHAESRRNILFQSDWHATKTSHHLHHC